MTIHTLASCVDGRAFLELRNSWLAKTLVREITASSPEGGGTGAWIRDIGCEPIELDTGEGVKLDVTEKLRAQYFLPDAAAPQTYCVRIEIRSIPRQGIQGSVYRFNFAKDGSVTAFGSAG